MNNMLPAALDYLIIRNYDIHQITLGRSTNYMILVLPAIQLYTVLVLEVFRYGMQCQM